MLIFANQVQVQSYAIANCQTMLLQWILNNGGPITVIVADLPVIVFVDGLIKLQNYKVAALPGYCRR